jgi:SIR2-like domain
MKILKNNLHLIEKIRSVLAKPDTVILVGSGVSVWSGLPTWPKLISDLADYVDELGYNGQTVRDALAQGDLTLAASYGAFQLTPLQFGQFIRNECRAGNAKHSELHRIISRLGPDCFITTNYDKLLEDALFERENRDHPRVITNNQVIDLPEIVRSTSRNFVFKYHGDVDNSETIVLTREQYAAFHGIYAHVSKALESLLATRPFFMIGFGLRDPDFVAVKDNLSATFKAGFGEHYAVVPDLDATAADYWRKVHSVEMLTYSTRTGQDGKPDHSDLIGLLNELILRREFIAPTPIEISEEKLLRISRFATKSESLRPVGAPLPLMVREVFRTQTQRMSRTIPADEILQQEASLILLGSPGAGKSFILKHFVADQAKTLLQICLEEGRKLDLDQLCIPFFVNLAIYQGDIAGMLQNELPTGLTISDLLSRHKAVIVLDAANEMPEIHIEDNTFVRDLAKFCKAFTKCRIIVSGRSGGWVEAIDMPKFELEKIDRRFVHEHFKEKRSVNLQEHSDLESTLQIPLFFNLATSLAIDLDNVSTPSDVHNLLVQNLNKKWGQANRIPISFEDMFSKIAFGMLTRGVEHFEAEEIEKYLKDTESEFSPVQITNFLLGEAFVHALPGRKLSFFHQSATEYFASVELGKRFLENPKAIHERLSYRRWDHALFLTLSRFQKKEAILFFVTLLEADISAALRAYHHAKDGREEMASKVLGELSTANRSDSRMDAMVISYQLRELQWAPKHLKLLLQLSDKKTIIGGAAAAAAIKLSPSKRVKFIKRLFDPKFDYNYISRMAGALAPQLSRSEFEYLLSELSKKKNISLDVLSAIGTVARDIPANIILEIIDREGERAGKLTLKFLVEALEAIATKECIPRFFALAKRGAPEWEASLHLMMSKFVEKAQGIEPDEAILRLLVATVKKARSPKKKFTETSWASLLLYDFYNSGPQWREAISKMADTMPEPLQIALLMQSAETDVRNRAEQRLQTAIDGWTEEEIKVISEWSADALFPLVLTKHREVLLYNLIMNISPHRGSRSDIASEIFRERPVTWWFDWTLELISGDDSSRLLGMNLAGHFSEDADFADAVAAELNRRDSKTFKPLLFYVVPNLAMSTDQLDDYVLSDLTGKLLNLRSMMGEPIIGLLASEDFAQSVLTPMWRQAAPDSKERTLLKQALDAAGKRHNRRYALQII